MCTSLKGLSLRVICVLRSRGGEEPKPCEVCQTGLAHCDFTGKDGGEDDVLAKLPSETSRIAGAVRARFFFTG